MNEKLLQQMKSLPKDSVVLVLIPRKDHELLHMNLLDVMVNKLKSQGAYVTLNRSYSNLSKALGSRKINPSNLLFIDCITKRGSKSENCIFLKSANSLTNIGMTLEPIYKMKDLSFVFFDSLDSLALYHSPKLVIRFARSLVEHLRESGKRGILLGLKEEVDKKLIGELSVVCDTVIDLSS